METLASILSFAVKPLSFLFVLTAVVFVHELGHFLVARWCGVKVKVFSIGFGREIWGFVDRQGTRWRLAWVPLGGYVKFVDDDNGASVPSREAIARLSPSDRSGAFHAKSLSRKSAIVVAGPVANFLLAIVILTGIYLSFGIQIIAPRVDEVVPDGAAARAGFKAGDLVLAIDSEAIESFSDMQRIVSTHPEQELTFTIDRGGMVLTLRATPTRTEVPDGFGGKVRQGVIGIKRASTPQDWKVKQFGPLEAVVQAIKESYGIAARSLAYIRDVVLQRESPDQLGGPIRIADVSGKVASAGLLPLLHLTALISISIGLINLFPIPLLDGGHLLFYGIEAVRRRPMSERTQEIGFRIGLAVILGLMIYVTINDLPIVRRWLTGIG